NLVRELLNEKAIFAPKAWSVRQAYRFLMDAPKMEEAGLVVRLPDWWSPRRPPRPQVPVHLGSRPARVLGLDTLLDFSAELTPDGEPLTEEERRARERMRQPEQSNGCQPGRDLQATLRPYQVDGVSWLWFMTGLGLGACLADDMGLGKTIQIIDLLLQRKQSRLRRSTDKSEIQN